MQCPVPDVPDTSIVFNSPVSGTTGSCNSPVSRTPGSRDLPVSTDDLCHLTLRLHVLCACECPHVEVVDTGHTRHVLEEPTLQLLHVYALGHAVQQDPPGIPVV